MVHWAHMNEIKQNIPITMLISEYEVYIHKKYIYIYYIYLYIYNIYLYTYAYI